MRKAKGPFFLLLSPPTSTDFTLLHRDWDQMQILKESDSLPPLARSQSGQEREGKQVRQKPFVWGKAGAGSGIGQATPLPLSYCRKAA